MTEVRGATPSFTDVPRLASDNLRSTVAVLISTAATVVASFTGSIIGTAYLGVDRSELLGLRTTVLLYFGFWIGYSLIAMLLTWRVFRRASAEQLRGWLRESESARRARRMREMLVAGSGPIGAVGFAAAAIGAVLVVAVSPQLRSDPLVVGLAVAVVATSWLLLVTAYAVHYAREEMHARQLEFAGDDAPTFYDYVYLAVQVSTTFSGSDVTVTGTAMRRALSGHAVVAFTFNSVIIALLVSLLLTGIA